MVIQELLYHYDGISEGSQRNKVTRADLKKIFYNNETTLTIEKYVTNIKGIFNVLEKYDVPLYKEKMVEHLLDHFMSPSAELKTEVNFFRSLHLSTFFKFSTYLSTVVPRLYPSANPSSVRFINSIN